MHIGACSLDTNRRAALVRLLLEGISSLDAAQAAIGHGAAIRPAELRVFLAFVMQRETTKSGGRVQAR